MRLQTVTTAPTSSTGGPCRATRRRRRSLGRVGTSLCLALLCLVLGASPASAAYEQVGNFAGTLGVLQLDGGTFAEQSARWPEEVQLGGLGGMAVNYTGAGGVPAGTVYAVGKTHGTPMRVARYNPDGSFSEAWTFKGSPAPEERCGPEGNPAEPSCVSAVTGDLQNVDVDVDQSTGYVYVYNAVASSENEPNQIHVYTPDGAELIASFGEAAAEGETTAASPGKLHITGKRQNGAIAVNSEGDVYVYDQNGSDNNYHRLMEFEPQTPGDYEHYVYAGQGHDVGAGFGKEGVSEQFPVADAAGNLYVGGENGEIAKFDPSQPAAPICRFSHPQGRIDMITVNPAGGEVFFHSENGSNKIHQLGAGCDGEGKFHEASAFKLSPNREDLTGLAFDPAREYEAGRPAGVLYAGARSGYGGNFEGEWPNYLVESSLGYIFSQPAEIPPAVEAESFANVTASTAELSAQVNPKGSATRYAFQYETEAQYEESEPSDRFAGAAQAPPGGAVAGEGTEAVTVSASLAGLAPDTAYRFRAVASSHCSAGEPEKVCEDSGEAISLRTFAEEAPGLADRRAYELVSPAQKNAGQVVPARPEGTCPTQTVCKPGGHLPSLPDAKRPRRGSDRL